MIENYAREINCCVYIISNELNSLMGAELIILYIYCSKRWWFVFSHLLWWLL